MTRQKICSNCPGSTECIRSHTGYERRDPPLSVLWELFHPAPSQPVPAVTDAFLQQFG